MCTINILVELITVGFPSIVRVCLHRDVLTIGPFGPASRNK